MAKIPVGLRLAPEMIEAVDAARGDVPRVRWIERAIEAALDGGEPREEVAPPRAPAKRAGLTGVEAAQRALAARRVKSSAEAKAGVKPIQRAKPKPGRS